MGAPVQSNSVYPGTSVSFPSDVTTGNLLVTVWSDNDYTPPGATIGDTLGNSWTAATPIIGAGISYFTSLQIWYAVANATGACTVFIGNTGNDPGVSCYEYSSTDIDTSGDPFLAYGSNDGSAANTNAPYADITVSENAMLFGAGANESNGGAYTSPGSGFTFLLHQDGHYDGQEDQFGVAAGSYTCSINQTNASADWCFAVVAFHAAGASPNPPVYIGRSF